MAFGSRPISDDFSGYETPLSTQAEWSTGYGGLTGEWEVAGSNQCSIESLGAGSVAISLWVDETFNLTTDLIEAYFSVTTMPADTGDVFGIGLYTTTGTTDVNGYAIGVDINSGAGGLDQMYVQKISDGVGSAYQDTFDFTLTTDFRLGFQWDAVADTVKAFADAGTGDGWVEVCSWVDSSPYTETGVMVGLVAQTGIEPVVDDWSAGLGYRTYEIETVLDAILQSSGTEATALDALLANIVTPGSNTTVLDALLSVTGETSLVNLDALLQKTLGSTFSVDALLQKNIPIVLSLDGLLKILRTIQTSMDAQLWDTYTSGLSLDGLLKSIGVQTSVSIDGLLNKPGSTVTTSLDAMLLTSGSGSESVSLDALISEAGVLITLDIDALLQKTGLEEITSIDAILLKAVISDLSIDALLQKSGLINTTALDAGLYFLRTITTKLDAILYTLVGESVLLDALLAKSGEVTVAALDAIIYNHRLSTAVIDSVLSKTMTRQINIEALLQGSVSSSTLLDAVIYSILFQTEPFMAFVTTVEKPAFEYQL